MQSDGNKQKMHSSDARGMLVLRDVYGNAETFLGILIHLQILYNLQYFELRVFTKMKPKRRKIIKTRD